MKRLATLLIAYALCAVPVFADTMRMAVTTSFHNSGLSDVLLPEIKNDLGLEVQLIVVGTGQALRLGEAGDVDAILVHSRSAEDAFVNAGHATHRTQIMYNDFVFIGPANDPAQIRTSDTAVQALQAIHKQQSVFVSRGDDSGTHKKERALWAKASLNVDEFGDWYRAVGSGMGAALNTSAGMDAYVIADRASWLNFKNKTGLDVLFSGDPELFNQYAFLPVNPDKHGGIKAKAAQSLEAWLTSETAKNLINGYTVNGEKLFYYNAK